MAMYGRVNHYAANPIFFTNKLFVNSDAGDAKKTDTNKIPLTYEIPGPSGYVNYLDVTSIARPFGVHGTMSFKVDDNLVADPSHGELQAIFLSSLFLSIVLS